VTEERHKGGKAGVNDRVGGLISNNILPHDYAHCQGKVGNLEVIEEEEDSLGNPCRMGCGSKDASVGKAFVKLARALKVDVGKLFKGVH